MKSLVIFAVAGLALFAGWEDVRAVAADQKVDVSVVSAGSVKGAFVSADDTGITVREASGERRIARDDVKRVRVGDPSRRWRNALIGAAIGAGAGAGIGVAACPGCANEGHGGKYVGPGIGAGAAIGAAIGLLPSPYRTIYKK